MLLTVLFASFLALSEGGSSGQSLPQSRDASVQSNPSPNPTPETGLKPGETKVRMICRTETTTGTRFSKRVCMTVEDAKRREEESSQGFSEMQRTVNTTYSRGN